MRDRRESIEQGLQKILPDRVSPSWISWVADEEIEDPSLEVYDRFCEPGRDLLKRGGKRWRPLLMAYVAEILGGAKCAATAYELAAVVEFPHTGSLIIDDIEDDSLWRRGAAAVHMIYGSDLSINAGNLLYYLPTRIIDTIDIADGKRLALYRIYARYLRRVHLGQGLDIAWHNDVQLIPSVGEYEQMCRFKTGCLAGMSAEIGACIATDDQQIIRRSGLLAEKIGVGFQIKDDVINLRTGNPGKHRGDDIVENKKSLPVILYLQRYPERTGDVQDIFEQAKAQGIFAASEQIEQLIEQMLSSGVVDEADRRAAELLQEALEEIYSIYPPCSARDELTGMLEGFLGT